MRLGIVLVPILLAACASNPMLEIRQAFERGDYATARERLQDLERSDSSNAHVYRLERGVVELAAGDPDAAEQAWQSARDRLDDLTGGGAVQWFASVLLDDRQLDYVGADYEHVLVRAALAAANLVNGGQDAYAYAQQVLARQLEIMRGFEDQQGERPKEGYKLVAIGTYLRAILAEEDPLQRDAARRAFEKVLELEPDFRYGHQDLARITSGQHSAKGNGVVHVIALLGRGPFRVAANEDVSQSVLALAQLIWALQRDRATFPNISAVEIPALAFWRDNPTVAFVSADGQHAGETATVSDVNAIAQAEFDAMRKHIVTRAVLRRAFKIAVTEGLKEAVNPKKYRGRETKEANPLIDLGISLAGLLWTAAEQADLRCWSLLPGSFQVLRVELPAGEHEITLRAGRGGSPTGQPQSVRVLVRDGYNTYVVAQLPTLGGGPPPLTSHPAGPGPADQ